MYASRTNHKLYNDFSSVLTHPYNNIFCCVLFAYKSIQITLRRKTRKLTETKVFAQFLFQRTQADGAGLMEPGRVTRTTRCARN